MAQTVSLCHFQVAVVIGLESEEKNKPCCFVIHRIKVSRALMGVQKCEHTHAHRSPELSQIERITVSNAPHLPLIVVVSNCPL